MCITRYELELLRLNQGISTQYLKDRNEGLEEKIKYSDAYGSCSGYRDEIQLNSSLLYLRDKYGVL